MVGTKLKFTKSKEKIPSRASKTQGLKGNKVKLAGNKKKSNDDGFKYLKKPKKSSYPSINEDVFSKLAREDISVSSIASSASSMKRKVKKISKQTGPSSVSDDSVSQSSFSSASTGMYSGSSLGSAGNVPFDKSFNILNEKDETDGDNPFGMSEMQLQEAEKQDILARFHTMRQRGVKLSKNYTLRSSLAELRMEMGRIEHEQSTHRSVQRLRRWLLMGVSGAQYATNSKFSPQFAKGKLNGFSDYVLSSLDDYDSIFEAMSEKYGGVIGIGGATGNPFWDLVLLLGTQMVMFIFMQHKAGVKPPTAEEIKKEHPDMIRKIALEMATKMREEEKTKEAFIRQEELQRIQAQYQQPVRETFIPPTYNAPSPSNGPTMPQYVPTGEPGIMPGPSIQFDLNPPEITEEVDQNAPDMFDTLTNGIPDQNETVSELHETTTPQQEWVPQEMDPNAELLYDPSHQEEPGLAALPEYEPIPEPETFPIKPNNTNKLVEMPQKTFSTRKGKPVKINTINKKQQAVDKPEETKNTFEIK